MSQTAALLDQLKKCLREANTTYADVARHLGLSEASIKRMFAQKNLSLDRLEAICSLIQLEISDLVGATTQSRVLLSQLNEQQEQEIVDSTELLLILVCLVNHWTIDDFMTIYDFKENECIKLLAKLDRLKIIELLPGNRVRLLLTPTFKWRDNGPIQRFFQQRVEAEFFKSRFALPTERLISVNGMMAESSNLKLQQRMQHLARDFTDSCDSDAQLPLNSRMGTTLVVAIRSWEYSSFAKYKRVKPKP